MKRREPAYKIYPNEFLENPVIDNALILEGKKLRRVRLLGNVKLENNKILLEGVELSGIKIKKEGIYDIIGKPRIEENNKYLLVEILKERNEKWKELRDIEIKITRKYILEKDEYAEDNDIIILEPVEIKEKILKIIEDFGGISFSELCEILKLPEDEIEKYIKELEEMGEIFEINGVYKIL